MTAALLANLDVNMLWFAAPLVIVVSLVYAATRHEDLGLIFRHAFRVATWIVGFMLTVLVVFLVLRLLSGWL